MVNIPRNILRNKGFYLCSCRYDYQRSVFTFPVYISNNDDGDLIGWKLELPEDNTYIFVPKDYSPRLCLCLECYGVLKSRGANDERPIYPFFYSIHKN